MSNVRKHDARKIVQRKLAGILRRKVEYMQREMDKQPIKMIALSWQRNNTGDLTTFPSLYDQCAKITIE